MRDYKDYKNNRADITDSSKINNHTGGVNNFGVDALRTMAESGDPYAQGLLGSLYLVGKQGVEEDAEKAVSWFRKAAEQGDPKAQCMLGECYSQGWGVKKDSINAFIWYSKAAGQGEPEGLFNVGLHNMKSADDKHLKMAFDSFTKAAEKGHAASHRLLGVFYEEGWGGVSSNESRALEYYEKAVQLGDKRAPEFLKKLQDKRAAAEAKAKKERDARMLAARKLKLEVPAIAAAAVSALLFHWGGIVVARGGSLVLPFALLTVCTAAAVFMAVWCFSDDWSGLAAIAGGIVTLATANNSRLYQRYPQAEKIFLIVMGALALVMLIRIIVKKCRPKP